MSDFGQFVDTAIAGPVVRLLMDRITRGRDAYQTLLFV